MYKDWAVVVAQLTEQPLPTPENPGSNPVIGNFDWTYLLFIENKWKGDCEWPIFDKECTNTSNPMKKWYRVGCVNTKKNVPNKFASKIVYFDIFGFHSIKKIKVSYLPSSFPGMTLQVPLLVLFPIRKEAVHGRLPSDEDVVGRDFLKQEFQSIILTYWKYLKCFWLWSPGLLSNENSQNWLLPKTSEFFCHRMSGFLISKIFCLSLLNGPIHASFCLFSSFQHNTIQ